MFSGCLPDDVDGKDGEDVDNLAVDDWLVLLEDMLDDLAVDDWLVLLEDMLDDVAVDDWLVLLEDMLDDVAVDCWQEAERLVSTVGLSRSESLLSV
jgi:hypothetical protein